MSKYKSATLVVNVEVVGHHAKTKSDPGQLHRMQAILTTLSRAPLTVKFGLAVILLNIAASILGPLVAPFEENEILDPSEVWEVAFWASDCGVAGREALACWDALNVLREHKTWLGTDHLGRDMLTRLLYGARNTISVAFVTTLIAFGLGVLLGFCAATTRAWVDQLISRSIDVVLAVPTLILALVLLAIFGTSVVTWVAVIAIIDAARVFRVARSVAVGVEVKEFVEAAKLRGEGLWWVIRQEVLPNTVGPLAAEFGIRFAHVFLILCALSFLGLGLPPPSADWGSMVRENAGAITFGLSAPLIPAVAIALLAIAVNLVVDWVAESRHES